MRILTRIDDPISINDDDDQSEPSIHLQFLPIVVNEDKSPRAHFIGDRDSISLKDMTL